MKRLLRSGLVLIICLLVVAGGAAPILAQESSDAAQQQYVFAYRLLQRRENKAAADAFDSFLNKFPKDEKRFDALFYRAYLAFEAGDAALAARHLTEEGQTKIVPEYKVQLLRAEVRRALGQHEPAIQALEKIQIDNLPQEMQAAVLHRRGETYFDLKNYAAAATNLAKAAEFKSPLQAPALLALGRVHAASKKPEDAITAFSKCVNLNDPATAPEAAFRAGELSYEAGKFAEAISFYRIVLTQYQSSPFFGRAATGVMWAQLAAGQYQDVIASRRDFNAALAGGDDQLTATYITAAAHQGMNQYQEAATLLKAVQASSRGTAMADRILWRLARSQFKLGDYDALNQTGDQLRQDAPQSTYLPEVDFLRATALALTNKHSDAAAQLTNIITQGASHPYYGKALLQRAKVYEAATMLEPAAADYKLFIKANPTPTDAETTQDVAVASLRLTDINFRLSKFDEAEASAKALLAQPKLDALIEQEALFRLAEAQRNLKKYDDSYATYNTLLEKHPQTKHANYAKAWRGLLLMAMNRPDAAVPDLVTAAKSGALEPNLATKAWRMAALRLRQVHDDAKAAEALAELEKIVGRTELTTKELLWLGRYNVDTGKAREALKYLEPLLKSPNAPDSLKSEAFLLTANCLRSLNDLDSAIKAYKQVIAVGGEVELEARLELARTLVEAKRYDEALEAFEGLYNAQATPIAASALFDSAMVHRTLARDRALASDPAAARESNEQAFALFKRLIVLFSFPQLSPLPQKAHIELAEVALLLDQTKDAKQTYEELAQKYADQNYAKYAKAMLASLNDKKTDAVFLLKQLREQPLDDDMAARVRAQLKAMEASP